jgi:hypothetical protein
MRRTHHSLYTNRLQVETSQRSIIVASTRVHWELKKIASVILPKESSRKTHPRILKASRASSKFKSKLNPNKLIELEWQTLPK